MVGAVSQYMGAAVAASAVRRTGAQRGGSAPGAGRGRHDRAAATLVAPSLGAGSVGEGRGLRRVAGRHESVLLPGHGQAAAGKRGSHRVHRTGGGGRGRGPHPAFGGGADTGHRRCAGAGRGGGRGHRGRGRDLRAAGRQRSGRATSCSATGWPAARPRWTDWVWGCSPGQLAISPFGASAVGDALDAPAGDRAWASATGSAVQRDPLPDRSGSDAPGRPAPLRPAAGPAARRPPPLWGWPPWPRCPAAKRLLGIGLVIVAIAGKPPRRRRRPRTSAIPVRYGVARDLHPRNHHHDEPEQGDHRRRARWWSPATASRRWARRPSCAAAIPTPKRSTSEATS